MVLDFPHEGDVQRKVLKLLYFNRNRDFTTKEISFHIHELHGSTYQALAALYWRRLVLRGREGNQRIWEINPNAHEKVRAIIGLPRETTIHREEELEFRPKFIMVKHVGYSIIKTSLNIFLPLVAPQVYAAYKIADSMFTYWSVISSCYASYKTQGYAGVVRTLGMSAVSSAIESSFDYIGNSETNIIWNGIKDKIPADQQSQVKTVMSTAVNELDEKEIDYVESYLSQN